MKDFSTCCTVVVGGIGKLSHNTEDLDCDDRNPEYVGAGLEMTIGK